MPRIIPLDGWCDPAAAFTALFGTEVNAFWLDGGIGAVDGRSWMGAPGRGDEVVSFGPDDDVFAFLGSRMDEPPAAVPSVPGRPLGWVGWFGYELGERTTGVGLPASPFPDAALLFARRIIEFDHAHGTMSIIALDPHDETESAAFDAWAGRVRTELAAASPPAVAAPGRHVARWRHDGSSYERLVVSCQEAIT
ncbi:MAG: hypothetical protein ABWX82_03580, partial [Leifsonia sp.]